jgi:hypothetical protein
LLTVMMLTRNPFEAIQPWFKDQFPVPEFPELPVVSYKDVVTVFRASVDHQGVVYRPHQTGFHKVLAELVKLGSKMKVCADPDCVNPYFVALRPAQMFCSEKCADVSRRKTKLRWWNANRRTTKAKAKA